MLYTCGLWVSSFSITPTPKAQYHLLGNIFPFQTRLLVFLISFFRWLFTSKGLNHPPTRFTSLPGILIPDSLINLKLEKMSSLPHTPDPEPVGQLIATYPHSPVLQGLHWHLPCSSQASNSFYLHCLTTQHVINTSALTSDKAGLK